MIFVNNEVTSIYIVLFIQRNENSRLCTYYGNCVSTYQGSE